MLINFIWLVSAIYVLYLGTKGAKTEEKDKFLEFDYESPEFDYELNDKVDYEFVPEHYKTD